MRWLVILFSCLPLMSLAQDITVKSAADLVYSPSYQFSGEVTAQSSSKISAQVSAELIQLPVQKGEILPAGKLIAAFDCRDLQDQLALTESSEKELLANLRLAELQFARLQNLQNRSLASDAAKDEALARKQSLESQLNSIRLQGTLNGRSIERCEVRAPYRAVVSEKYAGVGQWLAVGNPIIELQQLASAEIEVSMPLDLSKTMDLNKVVWKGETQDYSLRLSRLSNVLNPQSKMRAVWFFAPQELILGEQGTVEITLSDKFLPAGVLVQRNQTVGVMVVENGQAQFTAIPTATIGRPAKLPAGWESLQIVTDGQQTLQEGDKVN